MMVFESTQVKQAAMLSVDRLVSRSVTSPYTARLMITFHHHIEIAIELYSQKKDEKIITNTHGPEPSPSPRNSNRSQLIADGIYDR
jgi:hypothetical protein